MISASKRSRVTSRHSATEGGVEVIAAWEAPGPACQPVGARGTDAPKKRTTRRSSPSRGPAGWRASRGSLELVTGRDVVLAAVRVDRARLLLVQGVVLQLRVVQVAGIEVHRELLRDVEVQAGREGA